MSVFALVTVLDGFDIQAIGISAAMAGPLYMTSNQFGFLTFL
jgi:hypothetical protein